MSASEARAGEVAEGGRPDVWWRVLLALGLAYRIVVSLRPLRWLDGVAIPDDTYLSLTIARNIARGLGPLYGTGYTNGFQPLWVFVLAPLYVLIPNDPDAVLRIGLVLLALCDAAMALLVCVLVRRFGTSNFAAALVAACWAFNPYFVRVTAGGLETSLSGLLACAALFQLDAVRRDESERARPLLLLGFLTGLAFLARVDNVFLVPVVGIFLIRRPVRAPGAGRRLLRRWSFAGVAATVTVVPWLLYSWAYTSDLYPVSGRAVRLVSMGDKGIGLDRLWEWRLTLLGVASRIFFQAHAWLLGLLAALLAAVLVLARGKLGAFARALDGPSPSLLYGAFLFFAYPLHILAYWYFNRYYYPLAVPLLLVIGVTAAFLLRLDGVRRAAPALTAAFGIATIAFHLSRHETGLLFARDEGPTGYRSVGLWAAQHFSPGTRIGSSQTGALGYFATDLVVVNLDGVVNRRCFDSIEAHRNIDYIVDEKIEYVLGWKINIDFIRFYSTAPADDYLEPLGRIHGFRSLGNDWLLYRVRREVPRRDRGRAP